METLAQNTSRIGLSNEQAALEQPEVRMLNLLNNFPTSVAPSVFLSLSISSIKEYFKSMMHVIINCMM